MPKDEVASPQEDDADAVEARHQVIFRVPERMYRKIRTAANDADLLVSEFCRGLIREAFEVMECQECNEMVPGDSLFCPYCGVEFEEVTEDEDEEDEEEEEASPG